MTDHYTVFNIQMIHNVKQAEIYFMKRSYNMKNKQGFLEYFAETDRPEICSVTSTEIAFNTFR